MCTVLSGILSNVMVSMLLYACVNLARNGFIFVKNKEKLLCFESWLLLVYWLEGTKQ